MLQLRLLAPSATGQQATAYVSFLTGPLQPDHEVHIVLLDNGRSAMRADPDFVDALRCIRCGACSSICPSYGAVGGHVFGHIYSGAIGLVNTPFHHGLENDVGPQSLCVSCNACQTVCPVDIPLPRQILDTRAEVVTRDGMPIPVRAGIELLSRPAAFRLAARAASVAQTPIRRGAFIQPPVLRRLTAQRKPPALARRPFRDHWGEKRRSPIPGPLGRTLDGISVAYFVQCVTDWLYPEMADAIMEVLEGLGAHAYCPPRQHCCGLPALDSGAIKPAMRMARQTIEVLEGIDADYVVSGGTSCVVAMTHEYLHLFRDDPIWRTRAERQASRVLDFTSFMDRVARLDPGSLASSLDRRATYHYFCQSYNVLGFREEPMQLLRDACSLDMVPLPEANVCCGFGGSVSLNRPEMCELILERKLANLRESGADTLVTDNPGCIMHLRGGIAARGLPIEVKHTAEILAEAMRPQR